MNTTSPLVSIIMPAYNAEKYIVESIESVINQTYQNWELLIINDGSTDKTVNLISSFNDKRIQFTEQKNAGVCIARNSGISKAQGKYITFLDADDFLPPCSLEARVNYLESHSNIDLVDGRIIGKDMHMKNSMRIYEPYYTGNLLPRLIALDDRVFFNVCYMFKKEILGDIRFTENMTHAEDLLFYMELSNQTTVQYSYVPETIYWYRSGHESAMSNLDGLENGYLLLLYKVNNLKKISFIKNLMLHLKVARILFLCRLKRKEFILAFKNLFSIICMYKPFVQKL